MLKIIVGNLIAIALACTLMSIMDQAERYALNRNAPLQ